MGHLGRRRVLVLAAAVALQVLAERQGTPRRPGLAWVAEHPAMAQKAPRAEVAGQSRQRAAAVP